MANGGWIKLHRQIQDNWVWMEKPFSKGQAWIDLLLLANHQEEKIPLGDKVVQGERGTIYRSVLFLADRWGWSRGKTRQFLKQLESDKMVSVSCTTHWTTITVENYGFFQDSQPTDRQQNDSRMTVDRQQNDSKLTHTRMVKNKKKDKEGEERQIADLFNFLCPSLPHVTKVSDRRKRAIQARLRSGYTVADFEKLFKMAEASDFLKGNNSRNWTATFDWLTQDANMAKVIDGNYNYSARRKDGVDSGTDIQSGGTTRDFYEQLLRTGDCEEGRTV